MLAELLLEAGLLQFGRFINGENSDPVRISLEMLPSYPDIVLHLAEVAAQLIADHQIERLVCTSAALPFGLALSLKTRIPLVYSRGNNEPPIYDLVGAYDVGHPTALLTNILDSETHLVNSIANARRVGLNVTRVVAILQIVPISTLSVLPLVNLSELIATLQQRGILPCEQANAVQEWIATHEN